MLNDLKDKEIQPFHELAGNELICEMRKTPTVLYGIFVELLQQFWRVRREDWQTEDGGRLFTTPDVSWDPDPKKTRMWIDTELRWEATHPEFRPAIYVALSPIQYGTLDGSKDGLTRRDIQEAEYHYTRTGTGQVSFVHVGSSSGEACTLADATMDYLDAFSPVIRDDFCFNWFRLASRTPMQSAQKDSKEKYTSTITFEYMFTDAWMLKMETPKLKSLVIRTEDAVARRLEVGEYWNFKPADGGLGLPPGFTEQVNGGTSAPVA